MPTSEYEGGAGHRRADAALLHQPTRQPPGGTKEGIGSRAKREAARRGGGDQGPAGFSFYGQRLFCEVGIPFVPPASADIVDGWRS